MLKGMAIYEAQTREKTAVLYQDKHLTRHFSYSDFDSHPSHKQWGGEAHKVDVAIRTGAELSLSSPS
ncbi:hypothetical protein OUZ56_028135 [Daphnia magna]|uniref:Uncharacterized protein n=1 Tax=Daphnia magna TaxID=35525 RepID=A0ABR0B2Y5_9CRUS|nr:hypothetical protein OUZ56_028135 [Daphnia magna]